MTRALGGRSRSASRAAPIAVPRRNGAPAIGVCLCSCTGDTLDGANYGSGNSTISNGNSDTDANAGLDCDGGISQLCTPDMVASLTIVTRPGSASSPGPGVFLGARLDGSDPTSAEGYILAFSFASNPANTLWSLNTPGAFDFNWSSFPVAVANGDTMSLSVIGSTIIGSHNGSPLFTETDTTVPGDDTHTWAGWAVNNFGGGGDFVVGSFAVVPTCP